MNDADYAFDRTNPPDPKHVTDFRREMAVKASQCLTFRPQEHTNEFCEYCRGPKYAHTAYALRKKAG